MKSVVLENNIVIFFFIDVGENFLEVINNILNSGEIDREKWIKLIKDYN